MITAVGCKHCLDGKPMYSEFDEYEIVIADQCYIRNYKDIEFEDEGVKVYFGFCPYCGQKLREDET